MPKVMNDDEWLRAWDRAGHSPSRMAKQNNLELRGIYSRRRNIESKAGHELLSRPYSSSIKEPRRFAPNRIEKILSDGVVVIFSDAHFWPGEPTPAHTALCKVIKKIKPRVIVANGDVIDGATTSRHHRLGWEKQPKLWEEIKAAQDRMSEIERAGGRAELFFTLGNHDNRLDGWLANNAPEVEELPGTSLTDYFSRWQISMSLHINPHTPGHTVIKHRYKGGKYAGANNTLNSGTHIVTGHDHVLDVFNWADYTGRKYGVRTGQLSDSYGPQFHYAEDNPRGWCSGFAVLTFRDGLLLPPELCYVIDGEAYFRGEVI
jgi:hypothetical protein